MKHPILLCLMLCIVGLGCTQEDKPTYKLIAPPTLDPLLSPAFVLQVEAKDFIAETFSWEPGSYGFDAAPIFVLQIDNSPLFPDPIILAESVNSWVNVTVEKLNTAATILGGSAGEAIDLYIRLQAKMPSNIGAYSDVIDILVTPYHTIIEYPKLYLPGNYQGWSPDTAPHLTSWRLNNKYEGEVMMTLNDDPTGMVMFKMLTKPGWGKGIEYGSGDGPMSIKEKGGDIAIEQGHYILKVDLNTLKYEAITTP